jgi:hypothetical protein
MQMIAGIDAGALIASYPGLTLAALILAGVKLNQGERLFYSTGGRAC